MVPRYFLFGMHLQDTIWGARVSGGTVDQAAQYPQMIAYHLFCLLAKVGAKAITMTALIEYSIGSKSCFDHR